MLLSYLVIFLPFFSLLRPILDCLNCALQNLLSGTLNFFFKPLFAYIQLSTHFIKQMGKRGEAISFFSSMICNSFPNVRVWPYISHTVKLYSCQKPPHYKEGEKWKAEFPHCWLLELAVCMPWVNACSSCLSGEAHWDAKGMTENDDLKGMNLRWVLVWVIMNNTFVCKWVISCNWDSCFQYSSREDLLKYQ